MLKDSDHFVFPSRRSHRTYTPAFKAELVAACQQPGVSIASLAGQHGMNANVVHRWLKEYERNGRHRLAANGTPNPDTVTVQVAEFVPLQLSPPMSPLACQEIKIEVRKGAMVMTLSWPLSAASDFAQWTTAILK